MTLTPPVRIPPLFQGEAGEIGLFLERGASLALNSSGYLQTGAGFFVFYEISRVGVSDNNRHQDAVADLLRFFMASSTSISAAFSNTALRFSFFRSSSCE